MILTLFFSQAILKIYHVLGTNCFIMFYSVLSCFRYKLSCLPSEIGIFRIILVFRNNFSKNFRSSHLEVLLKISQNSQENTCARVSFLIKLQAEACNFIKNETLAQVFSCAFCVIFRNTFFTEHTWASAYRRCYQ